LREITAFLWHQVLKSKEIVNISPYFYSIGDPIFGALIVNSNNVYFFFGNFQLSKFDFTDARNIKIENL